MMLQKNGIILFLILIIRINSQFKDSKEYKICKKIEVRSNMNRKADMVNQGITSFEWSDASSVPVIIGSEKETDYIYFTVEGAEIQYNRNNFKLEQDDQEYAQSKLELDSSVNKAENRQIYAVQIIYDCKKKDGGSLINYRISMTIDNCGTSYVQYTKLCGNPLSKKDGLTLEMVVNEGIKSRIVKDGVLVNPSYFDSDLDSDVVRIPQDQKSTTFHIFLENQDNSLFNSVNYPTYSIDTYLTKIRVDYDQTIIKVLPESVLLKGGYIDHTHKTLTLTYNCLGRDAQAKIEVNFELRNFKDISLFFIKECINPNASFSIFNTTDKSVQSHWANYVAHFIFYILLVFLFIFLYITYQKKQFNPTFMFYFNQFINILNSIQEILKNKFKKSSNKFQQFYDNDNQDYELVNQNDKVNIFDKEQEKNVLTYGTF